MHERRSGEQGEQHRPRRVAEPVAIDIPEVLVYSARALRTGEGLQAMARDLGSKYICFKCGTKFYDLKKPVPTCPKCGADQREAPVAKPQTARQQRAAARAKEAEEAEVPAAEAEKEEDEEDEKEDADDE